MSVLEKTRAPEEPAVAREPRVTDEHGRRIRVWELVLRYALLLADLAEEVLEPQERRNDAECAIATIAMRRAGLVGRAPLIEDLALARTLLAYDGNGPTDFTRWRAHSLSGIAHDPELTRRLGDVALLAAELPNPPDGDAVGKWRDALRRCI